MRSAQKKKFEGAAAKAALLVSGLLSSAMPLTLLPSAQALAKMPIEQLSISPAAGGATREFQVEVASTDQEKATGLMFRTELADTAGMLFPYNGAANITMWMRNTYIPLDMLFIRADGTIHRIEAKAEPLSERVIEAGGEVSAVLELAGGAAERLGIKAGDRVQHPYFRPSVKSGETASGAEK